MVALLALVGTKTFANQDTYSYLILGFDDYIWGDHEDHVIILADFPVFPDNLVSDCIVTDTNFNLQIVEFNQEVDDIMMKGGAYQADGFSNENIENIFAKSTGKCK